MKIVVGAVGGRQLGRVEGTLRSILVTRKLVEIEVRVGFVIKFVVVAGKSVTSGAWSRRQLVKRCWRKRICGSRNAAVVIHVRSNRAEAGSSVDYLGETRACT